MARSFSNTKLLSAFITDTFSIAVTRRGYSAATQGVVSNNVSGGRNIIMLKKEGEEATKNTTSWVPDPVTGYYRPDSQVKEMDAAELREMLLKRKN